MRLEIDSLAIEDVKESISYYEREAGKGREFITDFDAAIDRIVINPLSYQILDEAGYRRCLFSQFPYGVFFKIMDDHIYVIAVAHHKRKPKFWLSRNESILNSQRNEKHE